MKDPISSLTSWNIDGIYVTWRMCGNNYIVYGES